MHAFNTSFEPRPNKHIPDFYDGELKHSAPNEQWTISYTDHVRQGPDFKFASHHSTFGDAAFRITNEDLLTPAEQRVLVLGALGLTASQTADTFAVATDTVKTQRRLAFKHSFEGHNAPVDVQPTMQSLIHILFKTHTFDVAQPLPALPDRLANPNIRPILEQTVTGKSQELIAEELGLSVVALKSRLRKLYNDVPRIHGINEAVTLMHLRPTTSNPRIS